MIQMAHVMMAVRWYTRSDHLYRGLLWLELQIQSVKQPYHMMCTPALFQLLMCCLGSWKLLDYTFSVILLL